MCDRLVLRAAVVVAAALGLVGCADAPPSPSPQPVTTGRSAAPSVPPSCGRLFVSPSGEPFHRTPGGACPLDAWFAGTDTNHDGELSRSEFKADAARFFALLDVNRDGVLEPEEVQRYERVVVPEMLGRQREAVAEPHLILAQYGGGGGGGMGGMGGGGGRGGGGGHRHEGGGSNQPHEAGPASSPDGLSRFSLLDEPEPVASADLNFDGRITAEEFTERASQRFDTLKEDVGALSLPALQARMAARAGNNQRHGSSPGRRRGGAYGGVGVGAG